MGFLKTVLKVVAVAAAVALAIPTGGTSLLVAGAASIGIGLSAVAATAIVAGLTIASSLINKPKSPSVSQASLSRLNVSINPREARKIVFGETAMPVDLRDMEYLGEGDEFLHYFLVHASHKVNAIQQIWFDDKLAWTSAGGVQGEFVNYLTVATRLEGSAANAINISPRMGATRRYTGCAYTHLRFKRTGIDSKAESPFAQSIPSRMTVIGQGWLCYDPRQDSTVPGGSGSHRVGNQATWTWGAHCRNPAIQMLNYLLGWRINGKLAVGKGMPVSRIHLPSFMAAANGCDEAVALAAGGTEPRYRSDGVFSEADDMSAVIEAFKTTMNAEMDDSDGRLSVRLILNDLADPIAAFDATCYLTGLTWRPIADVSDRFNVVRGQHTDPRTSSLYQMIDYPEVAVPSIDGIERAFSLPLPLVQSPSQAQRLARQTLQRQQYSGTLEVTTDHTGWRVQKYDIVTVTHPPLGFFNKLFRVAAVGVGVHGQTNLTLREENAAIYAWDKDEKPPVQLVGDVSYNYSNNPLLQGIETPVSWEEVADPNGTKPSNNADVTASSQVTVAAPARSNITLSADSQGVIKPDQLPIETWPLVRRGDTDISEEDYVTYAITGHGGLLGKVSVNNANGDPDKGTVTIDDTVTEPGWASLDVTVSGVSFGPFVINVSVQPDGAATQNPGGGGGRDNSLASIGSTSYVVLTGTHPADTALDVTVDGTEEIRVQLSASYTPGGVSGGAVVQAIAEYFDGTNWVQIGSMVTGSLASVEMTPVGPIPTYGSISATWVSPTLAAGTYPVRVSGRVTSASSATSFSSGFVATQIN